MEVALRVGNRNITITADKQQIIELLFSTFDELCTLNEALQDSRRLIDEHAGSLEAKVEERTQQLRALYRASLQFQQPLTLNQRLDRIVQTARELLRGGLALLTLWDAATERLTIAARAGTPPLAPDRVFRLGEGGLGPSRRPGGP